jgi:hypothetical protein
MSNRPYTKNIRQKIKRASRRAQIVSARLRGYHVVHLLHIGKTGGNAIRHALELGKEKPRRVNGWVLWQRAHDVTLDMCPEGDAVVVVVRHPLPRFVSAFWSRYRRGQNDPGALNAGEVTAFAQFSTPDELATALSDRNAAIRSAARQAMHEIEHVRHTLTFYLSSPNYLWSRRADIIHVGFQERLDADLPMLAERLGTSTHLPSDNQKAHRTPASFSRALSEQARANLEWWYAEDIRLYATCRNMADIPDDPHHPPPP